MRKLFVWIAFTAMMGVWNSTLGQGNPPDSLVLDEREWLFIQLTNGNWFYGSVVNKTDATIVLETPVLGEVTVQKLDIKYFTQGPLTASERQAIQDEERSKQINLEAPLLWPRSNYEPDPNATRYFFAPSAFQLDQDEAYYQNSYGLYNQASVGLSPGLTVGTNILAPVAIGFTAKAGFELSEKVRFSMGGLVLFPFWDDPVGLGFANLTFGSENSNVTFTAGTDFQGANIANISFLLPLNEQTWFISENYLIATSNWNNTAYYTTNIFSLGVRRFAMRRGFTWDYALIAIADEGIVLPFYSLTIPIKPKSERL
jgi:hypothetical protein